jgi:Zn ribbon nucleic-acid-binding protein
MTDNNSVRTFGARCPKCAALHTGATFVGNNVSDKLFAEALRPKAGDLTVCIECGAVNAYTESGNLRAITDQERADIRDDANLRRLITGIQAAVHTFGPRRKLS